MRFSETRRSFERMADRGHIKDEHVDLLAHAALYEMAGTAFGRAYYGPTWNKAEDEVQARRAAVEGAQQDTDSVIMKWEARARDVGGLHAGLAREAIHTTLDLPAILGRARDLVIRQAEEPFSTESALFAGAAKATRTDFSERRSIRKDVDSLGLFLQPEGTNVRYEGFSWTDDGYAIAKYSRAIGWTWEARQADDAAAFLDESAALGFAARVNRLRVLFAAIIAGTTRATLAGNGAGVGGPTIDNIIAARALLAANQPARRLGTVSIPVNWEALARATRDNQFVPASSPAELNPAYQTFEINVEEFLSEVLAEAPSGNALDWLAHDSNIASWLEFATLAGFDGGPAIVFKLPDVQGRTDLGSFDNMTEAMKVVDTAGAKVTDPSRVRRIAGA